MSSHTTVIRSGIRPGIPYIQDAVQRSHHHHRWRPGARPPPPAIGVPVAAVSAIVGFWVCAFARR